VHFYNEPFTCLSHKKIHAVKFFSTEQGALVKIFISILTLFISFQLFAEVTDTMADTLHVRMIEREPHIFQNSEIELLEEVPEQVDELREKSLNDLLAFAWQYELFDLGFTYKLSEQTYEVLNADGEIIGYTYSVIISKNGKPMTRQFSVVHRRVDGIFYVGRIANYDFE